MLSICRRITVRYSPYNGEFARSRFPSPSRSFRRRLVHPPPKNQWASEHVWRPSSKMDAQADFSTPLPSCHTISGNLRARFSARTFLGARRIAGKAPIKIDHKPCLYRCRFPRFPAPKACSAINFAMVTCGCARQGSPPAGGSGAACGVLAFTGRRLSGRCGGAILVSLLRKLAGASIA
jgi:hypothetical protein